MTQLIITERSKLAEIISQILPEAIEQAGRQNPEKLYSIPKAANKLGKDPKTIRRMVRLNHLQATACGKYISQKSIDNYLQGKK